MAYWIYMRVSTDKQKTDRQEEIIKHSQFVDVPEDNIVRDEQSGGLPLEFRPKLKELFEEKLRPYDYLVVTELSRFSRNIRDLLEYMTILQKKRVGFISIRESMLNFEPGERAQDSVIGYTTTMSAAEREYTGMRTRDGMAAKRAAGKPISAPLELFYKDFIIVFANVFGRKIGDENKIPAATAIKELKMNKNTFYKYCKLVCDRYGIYLKTSRKELPDGYWQQRLELSKTTKMFCPYHTEEEIYEICIRNYEDFGAFCEANANNYIKLYRLFILSEDEKRIDASYCKLFRKELLNKYNKDGYEEMVIDWYVDHKDAQKSPYVIKLFKKYGIMCKELEDRAKAEAM